MASRIAIAFAYVLCRVVVDQLGVARPPSLTDGLLSWDAHHYRAIADHGYGAVADGHRFFPLFPLLVRGLGAVLLGRTDIAGVVLANGCALALGVALYRLTLLETGNARTARLSTWLLLLSPAAVPLALGYSESVGLLATVLGLYALRRKRWAGAALAAVVIGSTWSIGALFALPVAVEAARGISWASWPERARRAIAVLAAPLATFAYLAWLQATNGHALHETYGVQLDVYHRGFQDPVSRLAHAAWDLVAGHHASGVMFPWALLALGLLVVTARRLPASHLVWSAAIVLVALCSHNVDSFERYALRAVPLAIAGALLVRKERNQWLCLALSIAGLEVYAVTIFIGARVP